MQRSQLPARPAATAPSSDHRENSEGPVARYHRPAPPAREGPARLPRAPVSDGSPQRRKRPDRRLKGVIARRIIDRVRYELAIERHFYWRPLPLSLSSFCDLVSPEARTIDLPLDRELVRLPAAMVRA